MVEIPPAEVTSDHAVMCSPQQLLQLNAWAVHTVSRKWGTLSLFSFNLHVSVPVTKRYKSFSWLRYYASLCDRFVATHHLFRVFIIIDNTVLSHPRSSSVIALGERLRVAPLTSARYSST